MLEVQDRNQSDLRRSKLKSCKLCGSNRPLTLGPAQEEGLIQHRGRPLPLDIISGGRTRC